MVKLCPTVNLCLLQHSSAELFARKQGDCEVPRGPWVHKGKEEYILLAPFWRKEIIISWERIFVL
jgi:hypothetical protein